MTHVGRSADAGHYMAWVRHHENPDDWWKFDGAHLEQQNIDDDDVFSLDDKVSPVKAEDVAKLSGGGDWHMAYLLLYRAKNIE